MYYKHFSADTWEQLDRSGDSVSGYQSSYLSGQDNQPSGLHVFLSESGKLHFVVADQSDDRSEIHDPAVNGLSVQLMKYRLKDSGVQKFIDIECKIKAYAEEFTEIVKEIAEGILGRGLSPESAVNDVISSWKSFWGKRPKEILSDEEQIGLLCELKILQILCRNDPAWALNAWKGPLGEKHDFVLSDQVLEVKGTRSHKRIHTINGIDQLEALDDRKLLFISFMASKTQNDSSLCLPDLIYEIESSALNGNAPNVLKFRKLLAGTGYSPVHKKKYRECRFDIYNGNVYRVDEDFPKLTKKRLSRPLSSRITDLKYRVELEGLPSEEVEELSF